MFLNPRTRLSSTPRLFLDGYRIGVRSHSDFTNATLYVRGDTALDGVCHAHRLKSTLPGIFQSDENMKKCFQQIKNPFYAMDRIQGLSFLYREGNIPSMGFKAQEIEQIFPFLVEENHGIKYVSYSPLIAVNWEATKELHQTQLDLVRRVDRLEQKLRRFGNSTHLPRRTNRRTRNKQTTYTSQHDARRRRQLRIAKQLLKDCL
jgi:hypothetical protein